MSSVLIRDSSIIHAHTMQGVRKFVTRDESLNNAPYRHMDDCERES